MFQCRLAIDCQVETQLYYSKGNNSVSKNILVIVHPFKAD